MTIQYMFDMYILYFLTLVSMALSCEWDTVMIDFIFSENYLIYVPYRSLQHFSLNVNQNGCNSAIVEDCFKRQSYPWTYSDLVRLKQLFQVGSI